MSSGAADRFARIIEGESFDGGSDGPLQVGELVVENAQRFHFLLAFEAIVKERRDAVVEEGLSKRAHGINQQSPKFKQER